MCTRIKLSPNINSYVPQLPIVTKGSKYSDWKTYINRVYGEKWSFFDLNEFEWFYWNSPLDKILVPKTVFLYDKVNLNEAWTMPKRIPKQNQKWEKNTCKFPPEGLYNQIGFFIRRKNTKTGKTEKAGKNIEVLRFQYNETGDTWFYNLKGSGIFVNTREYTIHKSNYSHAFNLKEYVISQKQTRDDTCKKINYKKISGESCKCDTKLQYLNCHA
jgi:hypothetical protein